jgi:drug/metabolite transporter (DMT)-like permease
LPNKGFSVLFSGVDSQRIRSNGILILTALIWGFAFVAQRVGMEYIGPMLFNGIRFTLGALSLLPLLVFQSRKGRRGGEPERHPRRLWLISLGAGALLFAGASLQQIGLVYTSAGNAGFITGLYIIIVPISGNLWGSRTPRPAWFGAAVALAGLYFLSVKTGFVIGGGDLLVLASAFFWALHVHVIAHAAPRHNSLRLSVIQYSMVAILSLITAAFTEAFEPAAIWSAAPAILYGGIMSVGVAYTLQVIGQRHAHPTHAAIILSLEGAFAALGGWLLLSEVLSPREFAGALLMLTGMIISQLPAGLRRKATGS